MPLDDTQWSPTPTIALAENNQVGVAPAENTKIAPAGYDEAPAEANEDAPAGEIEIAPAPISAPAVHAGHAGGQQGRAGAQCQGSAGGEQLGPPAAIEARSRGVQSEDTAQVREMQPEQTRRAGERPAPPTMTDHDLDEFLALVGGEADEADAQGYRFWRCPRCQLYALTNDPSRMMGEPCSLCERTNRARCVGRPACQSSCRGCLVVFCLERVDG